MAFSSLVILFMFIVLILAFLFVRLVRKKLAPTFAGFTLRTKYIYSILVIIVFLYQISFLLVFLTDQLYKLTDPWADLYWGSAGILGIMSGIAGVNMSSKFVVLCSIVQMVLGMLLLMLFVISAGITSM
ncbi:hypothetical protein QPK24_13850 [Paenibacillus polygoni]|uniref:Uncharacterized protein n=1 Tax=Paenibacillus polygoni TaxID=3050112 RepID=A0ABY8WXP2_9BACL|nr:hypothetical protein [Paenibacillus polygoni]WIV17509.1 hypothetical protein QPK24_13850 [Paenibacillus polygoni]